MQGTLDRLALHARPIAAVLAPIALWNAFASWLAFSYADTMARFEELPGLGLVGWLPFFGIVAISVAMVVRAVALEWSTHRAHPPGWARWLAAAGVVAILCSLLVYALVFVLA